MHLNRQPFLATSLRCALGLRQSGFAYPAFTPSARDARLGPCWAILLSRLTALLYGGELQLRQLFDPYCKEEALRGGITEAARSF
jgi:hypothetical protein